MQKRQPLALSTAYMLATIPAMFGVAGIHRFYMRRIPTGILYIFTWGLFGIGTIHDLIVMSRMVDHYNHGRVDQRGVYPDVARNGVEQSVVKVRCRYCGALNGTADNRCSACGGSL